MAAFKDSNGRDWILRLNVGTIRAIRDKHKVNLATLDGTAYDQLEGDPELLVDVLWSLCAAQATVANVTEVQFGEAMIGDAIENATAAMLEAIGDFFPSRKRQMVQTLAQKTRAMRELGLQKAMAKLEDPALVEKVSAAMDARLERDVNEALDELNKNEALNQLNNASDSQDSLESSPTP